MKRRGTREREERADRGVEKREISVSSCGGLGGIPRPARDRMGTLFKIRDRQKVCSRFSFWRGKKNKGVAKASQAESMPK